MEFIGGDVSSSRPKRLGKFGFLSVIIAFGAVGGIIALLASQAAVPLVVDGSVPQPRNPRVYSDDRSLIVAWDDTRPQGVVGYYLQYRKKGALTWENVRQTIHNTIQLQPLENGVEYEITIQSARGSYLETDKGDLVNDDSFGPLYWARADGHVSQPVTINGTPSSARIEAMRNRLTAFFDDFNEPANPFNELEWNNAAFCNDGTYDTASAFINNQFHSHNSISCGFGGVISRPRATFDTTVGLNGGPVSETNPAQIEFDMDLQVDGRSKWYLDLIPLSARKARYPIDIDSHHTADDSQDHNDPGNMLRLDVHGAGFGLFFAYWDKDRNFHKLDPNPGSVCNYEWDNNTDFRLGCNMANKTLNMSPLPESNERLFMAAQNVRRHWVMQFTPTKARVFVDGALISQVNLPPEWAAEKQYTLQNTMFSYNTAKGFSTSIDSPQGDGASYMGRRGIIPKFHFYHWDNFGFTGPRPTTVIHNYIDGGPDGMTPKYLNYGYQNQSHPRTTNIKIPDDIGTPLNNKGRLHFTVISNNGSYMWAPGDHIVFNGRRYDLPDIVSGLENPPPNYTTDGLWADALSLALDINAADIKKGDNIVTFNLKGRVWSGLAINTHLELEYPLAAAPSFTQPITIYRHALSNQVEPKITNCDSYIYVEQDIGLPYLGGKQNMEVGPCEYLQTMPHHEGAGRILNALNFEAEELNLSPTVVTGSDPNASKGAYIQY